MPKKPCTFIPEKSEELKIDCSSYSNESLKQFICELHNAKIKSLTLLNVNRNLERGCGSDLFSYYQNFVVLVTPAISRNHYLEVLNLDRDFIKSVSHMGRQVTFNFSSLLSCLKLKTLIIQGNGWHPEAFKSLERYLTHPDCDLENLELYGPLTGAQITKIPTILKNATSLKTYKGLGEEEFQALLDKKPVSVQCSSFNRS